MNTKICLDCKIELPIASFGSKNDKWKQPRCYVCRRAYRKHLRATKSHPIPCPQCKEHFKLFSNGICKNCNEKAGMLECCRCNEVFLKNISMRNRSICKECADENYHSQLLRKYNLTIEDFNRMLAAQNYRCRICKRNEEEILSERNEEKNKKRAFCIDHSHKTNRVRGILCSACNVGLGLFKDNATSLEDAIQYLQDFFNETNEPLETPEINMQRKREQCLACDEMKLLREGFCVECEFERKCLLCSETKPIGLFSPKSAKCKKCLNEKRREEAYTRNACKKCLLPRMFLNGGLCSKCEIHRTCGICKQTKEIQYFRQSRRDCKECVSKEALEQYHSIKILTRNTCKICDRSSNKYNAEGICHYCEPLRTCNICHITKNREDFGDKRLDCKECKEKKRQIRIQNTAI